MSKDKTLSTPTFWGELFQLGVYKRTQGRITRQMTCLSIWAVFALGAYKLNQTLTLVEDSIGGSNGRIAISLATLVVGLLIGYRAVNYSKFADFLISVEAEMNKVSWPSRGELVRSSIVVIVVMFALALILWSYDLIWVYVFKWLRILRA